MTEYIAMLDVGMYYWISWYKYQAGTLNIILAKRPGYMWKYVVIITFISRTTRSISDVFVHVIGCSVWRRHFVFIIRPI